MVLSELWSFRVKLHCFCKMLPFPFLYLPPFSICFFYPFMEVCSHWPIASLLSLKTVVLPYCSPWRKILKLYAGAPSQTIRESTIMQAIKGLNETINLVLDFLQDSKVHILISQLWSLVLEDILQDETWQDHGQQKGDDLLAAVRIVGRCATPLIIVGQFMDSLCAFLFCWELLLGYNSFTQLLSC